MTPYKVTNEARADLHAIASYTRRRYGRVQLERYMKVFREAFMRLSEDPNLGRPAGVADYSRYEVGRHVVIFNREKKVRIVRVLHDRMLPELHLNEDD